MRLSHAGLRRRETKPIHPHHRLSPWFTEDAARDRSNRLLEGARRGSKQGSPRRKVLTQTMSIKEPHCPSGNEEYLNAKEYKHSNARAITNAFGNYSVTNYSYD
jgi:hypothetical protein